MKFFLALCPALALEDFESDDLMLLQLSQKSRSSPQDVQDTLSTLAKSSNPQQVEAFVEQLAQSVSKGEAKIDDATKAVLEGVKQTFADTSEPAIEASHDEDLTLLNSITTSAVGRCSRKHQVDKAEDVRQGETVEGSENLHKTCRNELKTLEDDRDQKCGAFENFRQTLSPPTCTVPSSTDGVIGYLEAMQTFSGSNLQLAKRMDAMCKEAIEAVDEKKDDCNSMQAQYESGFCQWRVEVHETCHEYQTCYESAAASLDTAAETTEKNAESRKLEWKALQKIKCYIDVLISDDDDGKKEAMNKCQDLDPDMSHLDMVVPALPAPDSCDFASVSQFPCTDGFLSRYAGLSGVATCTACAALEPHLAEVAPSAWKLVFRQTMPTMYANEEWSKNPEDPSNANYAILDQLENFRRDGKFLFKLHWPNSGLEDQIWEQTNNPAQGSQQSGVEGYKAISAPHANNYWAGLERGRNGVSMIDGSVNHGNWYYAVGSHRVWSGGIPGPRSAVQVVELYVRTSQPGTWTTLYSKGSFGDAQTDKETFNDLFQKAGSGIVRRQCKNCNAALQDVYFKRKTDVASWDAYENLLVTWRGDVGFHTDFDIYSTYDDAVADTNAFKFCNGNDPGIGFPRDCGPTEFIGGQWTSVTRGGQTDYSYSTVSM
jgi:hypothetical protein